ncbi:MAG: OmpA family protein [Alphaproteobacteria bacterium]|nr:OmpA family protein [Alphaproteobacteria bacterium]
MAGITLAAPPAFAEEIVIFKSVPSAEEVNNVLFGKGGAEAAGGRTRSLRLGDSSSGAGLGGTRAISMHNSAQDAGVGTPVAQETPAAAPVATANTSVAAANTSEPAAAPSSTGVGLGFNLQFDFDSVELVSDSKAYIDRLGEVLGNPDNAGKQLLIVGHTDGSGSDGYNTELSERRAVAIRNYLTTTWSIDPSLLQIKGAGESQPLDGTDPLDGVNRRVEFFAMN